MATTQTPVWTDNVTVLAPYGVIKGESYRTTTGLDLRAKPGAMLKLAVAGGGSTALTAGSFLNARVRRCINNDGVNPILGAVWAQINFNTIGKALINNASNYSAAAVSIAFDGAAGTAFAADNVLLFTGKVTIPTASGAITADASSSIEWIQASKCATSPILLATPTKGGHIDNEVITIGQCSDIWLPGGSLYCLELDHLLDAAGEIMIAAAYLQSYDSDTST